MSLGDQWIGWWDAGIASKTLIGGLVDASRRPNIREIVIVNAPLRIHGAPVAGDWASAIALSGGRKVRVVTAPSLDYPATRERILDGPDERAVRRPPPYAAIASMIPRRRYSRYVTPKIPAGSERVKLEYATIELHPSGELRVRVSPAPDGSRAAYLWSEGRLDQLF